MRIQKILDGFVKECSKKLKLSSIVQFGSSAYSKKFKDIDLMFISSYDLIPTREHIEMIKLVKSFEKKYPEVVFDFGGSGTRKRKAKYPITVIHICKEHLRVKYNPHDLFFFRNRVLDKDMKILFGENIFNKMKFSLTKRHLFEMLIIDLKHLILRKSLDGKAVLDEGLYHAFKVFLIAMVIKDRAIKKENLIETFKKKFREKIKLPSNSKKIINKNIKEKDLEEVLKFMEDCLRELVR